MTTRDRPAWARRAWPALRYVGGRLLPGGGLGSRLGHRGVRSIGVDPEQPVQRALLDGTGDDQDGPDQEGDDGRQGLGNRADGQAKLPGVAGDAGDEEDRSDDQTGDAVESTDVLLH